MLNKVNKGNTLKWTNGTGDDVVSGQLVVLDDMAGVAVANIADGETGTLEVTGVFELTKVAGGKTFAQGQAVYWNPSASKVTPDADDGGSPATAYVLVGYAFTAASGTDTAVNVRLKL